MKETTKTSTLKILIVLIALLAVTAIVLGIRLMSGLNENMKDAQFVEKKESDFILRSPMLLTNIKPDLCR